MVRNLLDGYGGKLYPVNPKGGEILGCRAYESLAAIGAPVDLIVVAIPIQIARQRLTNNGNPGLELTVEDAHVLATVRRRQ
jgi:acetyltransferase